MSYRFRHGPAVHVPQPDPDAPGVCCCGLLLDVPNSRHIAPTDLPDNPTAADDARRLGEPVTDSSD